MARPMPLEVQSTLRILDDMMRHHGLKTMDLFHRKDFNTSLGEDPDNPTLSWDELYIILKKWGVISNVTAREVKRLVVYLDTSGDGVVDHQELTFALRRARRDGAPRDGMVRLTLVSAALQPPFPSAHFQHFVFIHAGENCRNDDHRPGHCKQSACTYIVTSPAFFEATYVIPPSGQHPYTVTET